MINTRIEIDGEIKDVLLFDDLFEYVTYFGSDISHYTIGRDLEEKFIVEEEYLLDDVDFKIGDIIEVNGKEYVNVNWGEEQTSFINDSGYCQDLYSIYQKVGNGEYHNFQSMFFTTEEDAQKKADELNGEDSE